MTESRFAYPIVLNLFGRRALVVGGGEVALRKARALADAGARVRVVAPKLVAGFTEDGRFECLAVRYEKRHLEGALVAVAATDDEAVNRRIAEDARVAGVLVNVVDRPELCDFIVPAQVRRVDLLIAISPSGAAPSRARRLRERLEKEFGPEYATLLEVLREVREDLKQRNLAPEVRRRLFERLTEDDLVAAARRGTEALRTTVAAEVAKAIAKTRA
ncbi:MAG: bifunctional precorrin-2 dehydrogenase/sirohydrochlorin ferrochelatase [Planctomycetota bacterium]|nr:bifunctional precorrin-2 dehydrogenase/sirohydrochlorin ferrochelatase [Planctomycetota bacterium]